MMSSGESLETSSELPPVVLLHGWGGSFEATWVQSGWHDRLRSKGRRVVRLDLPGHGRAPDPIDPAAYADLASLVRERLTGHGTLDMIGFSLGAKLTLAIAAREPKLVRRAVVCGLGANVFAPEKMGNALAELLEQGVTADAPVGLAELVRYGLSAGNDARRLAAVMRRPANPLLSEQSLSAVRCPVLAVVGDRDAIAQPVEPLIQALPKARLLKLPGVDHLSLPPQQALIDAAIDFISR